MREGRKYHYPYQNTNDSHKNTGEKSLNLNAITKDPEESKQS